MSSYLFHFFKWVNVCRWRDKLEKFNVIVLVLQETRINSQTPRAVCGVCVWQ